MKFAKENAAPLFLLVLALALLSVGFALRPATPVEAARVDQMDGAFTIGSSTVATTTSTAIIATSTGRQFAQISNDSANDVYLAIGQAAVKGKGILLKASGGTFTIDEQNLLSGAINGIASTSATGPSSNVTVIYK